MGNKQLKQYVINYYKDVNGNDTLCVKCQKEM